MAIFLNRYATCRRMLINSKIFIALFAIYKKYFGCHALFAIYEKIFSYPYLKKTFKKRVGYELDLKIPLSFNQKINWKKIHDRNPLLPITADKYRVREYIYGVLGKDKAEEILVPLLYVTAEPESIPFNKLPAEYIIKANHRSGKNIIVTDDKVVDKQHIIKQCRDLLFKPYAFRKHEWAYQPIARRIIIEALLRDEDGKLPSDYKFHMLSGKCSMIQVIDDRFEHKNTSFYTNEWSLLNVARESLQQGTGVKRPDNLKKMIDLAENLSKPFDYVRVDLYSIGDRIYFGELTHYPQSGMGRFIPESFDFDFGANWALKHNYWKSS